MTKRLLSMAILAAGVLVTLMIGVVPAQEEAPAPDDSGGPAAVGSLQLTVDKVVDGTAPAGTTFTVTVVCTDDVIADPNAPSGFVDSATIVFDAVGTPQGPNTFTVAYLVPSGTCTVTETDAGEADSTTYECRETLAFPGATVRCGATGPTSDPAQFQYGFTVNNFEPLNVTVTNGFDPEAPAPAADVVAAQPSFTG